MRPSPPPAPAMSRRRKQALKFTSDNEVGVITDKIKRKEIEVGRKKRNLPVAGEGAGEVSGSQPKKKIEAEMIEEPQPEGKIQAVPVVVEAVSSGPSEKERGQDHPPSLARGKSQEERFDELKRFTPRRMNLLSRFTEISEKKSRDQASPSSSENNIEIKPRNFVRDHSRSLTPKPGKFSSGTLAEAAAELRTQTSPSPFQRSKKWLKPGQNSPRSPGLSERSLNSKINKTGSLLSSPGGYELITAEESPEKEQTESTSNTNSSSEAEAVVVPTQLLPHKIGIQNRGNTCYLNSTVQALLGLPMLVTDAVNLKFALEKLEVSTEVSRLVAPFTAICQAQTRADVARTNVNAMRLKRDMEQLDSQFAGNKMQDANEFLCRFLDELKENVGKIFSESGSSSELVVEDDAGQRHRLTNLVDTNFQYERQETFTCCACGHSSHVKHSDVNFFCDLSGERRFER